MKYFQDETDSIAETESDRVEVKGREEAEREREAGGAINLTSRPPSQPTTNINDIDTEVSHSHSPKILIFPEIRKNEYTVSRSPSSSAFFHLFSSG